MFVTKRFIYTEEGKKENKIILNGIEINPFLLDLENPKSFYKDALFYDYDFSFLGDFFYFDETIANINNKIFEHNLLTPKRRKEQFNDLTPLKNFFEKYLKKDMIVISFENLDDLGIKSITPFEALKLEQKLNKILIKNRGEWIDIKSIDGAFVYGENFYLKIDNVKKFSGVNGVCKIKFKKDKRYLNVDIGKILRIDLLELIKVEK
jgi:hypothetical protein